MKQLTLKGFFHLVEIQTKLASVTPLLLGTAFAVYRYGAFDPVSFSLMFLSLLAFDMATTTINNYIDYKHEPGNAIVVHGIKPRTVMIIISILVFIAVSSGILLTLNTGIVVLAIGALSFCVGILYTYGPIPISRMPLGEIVSGTFMGFVIIFLSVYIQAFDTGLLSVSFQSNILSIDMNPFEIFIIFMFSIPAAACIANIMLANNICDLEEDITKKRFTLPYYIGKKNALSLFKILYYISYIDIVMLSAMGITPIWNFLVLLTFIRAKDNIAIFTGNPIKSKNFVISIKNFTLINLPQIFIIGIAALLK